MTSAQRQASIRRHTPFLTSEEQAQFMPTEAELLAIDHTYAIAKANGVLFAAQDRRALQRQINEGSAA